MSKELEQRIAELQQENDELNKTNLELCLRRMELITENYLLWDFVFAAKNFDRYLQKQAQHRAGKEYMQFMMGLFKLSVWLKEEKKRLEKETGKPAKSSSVK